MYGYVLASKQALSYDDQDHLTGDNLLFIVFNHFV